MDRVFRGDDIADNTSAYLLADGNLGPTLAVLDSTAETPTTKKGNRCTQLRVRCAAAPAVGQTFTFTVIVNGVARTGTAVMTITDTYTPGDWVVIVIYGGDDALTLNDNIAILGTTSLGAGATGLVHAALRVA